MGNKKISAPNWNKISRGEYEEKRKQDLNQIEKAIPKTEPKKIGGVIQTPVEKERKQKKEIRKHMMKMHEDALTKILGLDNPEPEMCQACFQVLQGDVFVSSSWPNLYLCRKCYQSLDRCSNCSRPVKRPIKGVTTQYCEYCKSGKECTSCGKEIVPKYGKRISGIRGFYCEDCITDAVRCYYCGVPVVKNALKIGENEVMCKECLLQGILKNEQANDILNSVRKSLNDNFKIRSSKRIKTGVAPIDDIIDEENNFNYRVIEKEQGIYIITALGMPVIEFKGMAAQEFARDYIKSKLGSLQPDEIYHGFGKFIRYNYLKISGYLDDAHVLKKHHEYKKEFQHFIKLDNKLGFSKVITTINKGKMPLMV